MNRLLKIGILLICVLIGYSIGNYLPIEAFKPSFTDDSLSKGEYYRLVVSIISASITFLALVIALFKDDIREQWKRPRISFTLPEKHTVEDTDSALDSESGAETIKAKRYVTKIEITNSGNLPALSCEMYLDKLEFIPKDTSISQHIECSSAPLEWNGTESSTIIIPPGGKKLLDIVEVTAPEKVSTPDSEKTNNKTQLLIGTIPNSKDQPKGKWKAKFSLYAQNHTPVSFEIEVEWNGVWKNRLTEFKSQFQIKKA
ncbi:hypothetical protein U3A58_21090 [Algoriphagus sp. C2-6-M1]|uniref:hypothetical protein n=1 Tax=Algoriphagus persicinus TaxID=3108754 RepID=UPI002B38B136|nr:hypothetical protein [Algoriphagus sp. C2-6-M1]MEB2782889.1 hypothetical protein [Algoriphagus sp. C2-6-M1]